MTADWAPRSTAFMTTPHLRQQATGVSMPAHVRGAPALTAETWHSSSYPESGTGTTRSLPDRP